MFILRVGMGFLLADQWAVGLPPPPVTTLFAPQVPPPTQN